MMVMMMFSCGFWFSGELPFLEQIDCCYLMVDGRAVFGPIDFRRAVMAMFASYYVFNIQYPLEAAATLEFIQR
jgi:hypothetical protein